VGTHCLPLLLARGYEVHAVSCREPSPSSPRDVTWHSANLLDDKQVEKLLTNTSPSHLLHLAWYSTPGRFWSSTENLEWVRASIALIQRFAQAKGRRLVAAGSSAEYDWRYGYCSETITPLAPATLYGACKNAVRAILDGFSHATKLSAAWGRLFFLYGPHEHPQRLVASIVRSIMAGEPAACTHGRQLRDFLFVADVADALVAILDSSLTGPVNVASGKPLAVGDVVTSIAAKLGRPELLQFGVIELPASEPPLLVADVTRLSRELAWAPKYTLDAGLDQTIDWWRGRVRGSA
jgi:nucleoside-diphosphate-sugar epimerase